MFDRGIGSRGSFPSRGHFYTPPGYGHRDTVGGKYHGHSKVSTCGAQ